MLGCVQELANTRANFHGTSRARFFFGFFLSSISSNVPAFHSGVKLLGYPVLRLATAFVVCARYRSDYGVVASAQSLCGEVGAIFCVDFATCLLCYAGNLLKTKLEEN